MDDCEVDLYSHPMSTSVDDCEVTSHHPMSLVVDDCEVTSHHPMSLVVDDCEVDLTSSDVN